MTFLGRIFQTILIPVLAVTGFLFGGHTIPQNPPAQSTVVESTTSLTTTSSQVISISQSENQTTKNQTTGIQKPTCIVSISPTTITQGGSALLSWTTTGVQSDSIAISSQEVASGKLAGGLAGVHKMVDSQVVAPSVSMKYSVNSYVGGGVEGPSCSTILTVLPTTQSQSLQATQPSTTSSDNSISSNETLCNGTYYSACPAGQQFICANDGIKPYCQVPPPPATTAQIAEIAQLCSYATSQGDAQVIQYCTDGTILSGYNTNAIFRSNIDTLSQKLQQKITQQETAINNQIYVQNWISALNTTNEINQSFVNEENSLNAQNAALQQQEQDAQILQTVQQNQQLLQQMANTSVQTHCGIDAGVFSCNIPN